MDFNRVFCYLLCAIVALHVGTASVQAESRVFISGFEDRADFQGFYITPQSHLGTTWHNQSSEMVHSGNYAHKAWVNGANKKSWIKNTNHRGYPTVQLHKRYGSGFACPCGIRFWVWLDMPLQKGEWFSFATLTGDRSNDWDRTLLVNLSDSGFVHLMHVPNQGEGKRIFQTDTIRFPQRQWVKLEIILERDHITVWQDNKRVSEAAINGFSGVLEQAHFGMYAPPSVRRGIAYNDDLEIYEHYTHH